MPQALADYADVRTAVVALGTFDGVHLGHQALLNEARRQAKRRGARSLALTFSQPPGRYLGRSKPLLLPASLKYGLLERFVDRAVVADFPDVAWMPPEQFVWDVLLGRLRIEGVVVGWDHRFGKDRAGDAALLRTLGKRRGFEVFELGPLSVAGAPVSSTRVRGLIRDGHIAAAQALLGRPPLLRGRVVRGEGIGRALGYPTANLLLDAAYALPAQGIFAGLACLDGAPHPAALYVGNRPTFAGDGQHVEAHLLDGPYPDLYGRDLLVHLTHKLRDDATFADADALRAQIARDVAAAREALASADLGAYRETPCPEAGRAGG